MPGTGITVLPCITPGYRPSRWTKRKPLSPGPKNFSISAGLSNFPRPDMALGTTGVEPRSEGLIFGVCQISASQDRVPLLGSGCILGKPTPISLHELGPHEGRRTCGLRRWYDSVNHRGGLLLLPETLITTSAHASIPASS